MSQAPLPSISQRPPAVAGDVAQDGMPLRFGKYTLIRKLATGGMAELFLAIQRSVAGFEKLIVIKRILPQMNQDRAFIEMLLSEARIAATLSHPNIVQIFDVGQHEGIYFIAMEHVHGEDLRSIVRQMKKKGVLEFPIEHALAIVLGMCAGLAYAHEKRELDGTPLNIVHRDISPQNVVVTFTGDVKIVDFGIAKSDNKLVEQTKSGKLKGKVPYMSPEQARGENVDARSDIFATGVMLFELTTGKRLFKGTSEYETLKLICDREYPRPSQVRPGYPDDLEQLVVQALAKDRNYRYQSARDLQADLEAFVRRHQIAVSNIALNQFMQGLFEDKLASQKEALLQGKQLADIIELQRGPESSLDMEASGERRPGTTQSMPAAAHTVTNIGTQKRSSAAAVFAVIAVLLAAGALGGFLWVRSQAKKGIAQGTELVAPPPEIKGSIDVSSDPPGAAIWINGDLRPEVTPATISQLPLGTSIDVKLTMDGFEQAKQDVELSKELNKSQVSLSLKKGTVVVDISVKPDIAKPTMTIDGKPFTTQADGLTSGIEHKVVVSAPGYVDQTIPFIGNAMETKHFDVVLDKEKPMPKGARPAGNSSSSGGTTVVVVQPQGPQGNGKLNVGASGGWCNVSVDGAPRGATPVAGLDLSAGPHRITCTGPDGKTQSATVNVPSGDTARFKFTL